MKISQKIILGFVGIALLAGVVGANCIFQSKITHDVFYKKIYESFDYISDAREMMEVLEHQRIAANRYIFLGKELKHERADYFEEKERLENIYDKFYSESCGCVRPMLKETYAKIKAYNIKLEEAFAAYAKGEDFEAVKEKINESALIEEFAHASIEEIIEHISEQHIEPSKANIDKRARITMETTLIAVIGSLCLAIGLGYSISKVIAGTIIEMKNAVVEIGKGELDTKIEIKSKDEIGEFASSFNKMAKDLKVSLKKEKGLAAAIVAVAVKEKEAERLVSLNKKLESANTELKQANKDLKLATEKLQIAGEETQKVKEAAEKRAAELERFNKVVVGRELKMKELKERIKKLEEQINRKA
ncbi:MAG: HAMP domain-containing protein [Candidatus Omnitrophica bacterium]|nr:HAMP domain-containing protein [Candidatus Omnitrophota bacterium]